MIPEAMTDDELRIEIAKILGWSLSQFGNGNWRWEGPEGTVYRPSPAVSCRKNPIRGMEFIIPNYPQDLNAIQVAVKGLSETELHRWRRELNSIVNPNNTAILPTFDLINATLNLINATARERSEAFVRAFQP